MNRILRFAITLSIAVAAALCLAALHQSQVPTVFAAVAGAQDQAPPDQGAPDQGPDPAAINMAPGGPSYTTEAPPPDQSAGPGHLPTIQATPRCQHNRRQRLRRRFPTTTSRLLLLTATSGPRVIGRGARAAITGCRALGLSLLTSALWTPGYWGQPVRGCIWWHRHHQGCCPSSSPSCLLRPGHRRRPGSAKGSPHPSPPRRSASSCSR